MRVLGVDPGSIINGYGIVEEERDNLLYIESGEISVLCDSYDSMYGDRNEKSERFYKSERFSKSGSRFSYTRLKVIYDSFVEIIRTYSPDVIVIEDIFFSKNVKSTIKLGYCRGAIILAALNSKLDIYEYTPLEIKKAIVGYGRATKEQVEKMVKTLLNNIPDHIKEDASDSLAVAICHINSSRINRLYDSTTQRYTYL